MSKSKQPEKASLYAKRQKIYTKVIKGQSHHFRLIVALLVYGTFFTLPWINWGDRPAVYFDLVARQFHIFGFNFWPQDFMFLAWTLIIAAFSLFLFTTVAGRLWCGYACPQTMWTLLFMWIEQKIEGKPHQRKRLDDGPLTAEKVIKKVSKHIIWLLIAFETGITFVSYFYPVRQLLPDLMALDLPLTAVVWIGIFTYLTYIDAAWLREQVCIYMCPYARFQSVMYDKDTLLVSYDASIGEPRHSVKDDSKDGACIDCHLCVQVCPTGIDIRDGQQISCINCGLCLDACAEVMESIGRPANLIKFTTLNQLEGEKPLHIIRPKTIAYTLILTIMVSLLGYNLLNRKSLETSILRDREHIYTVIDADTTANDYLLKMANKSQLNQNYHIQILTSGYALEGDGKVSIPAGELLEKNIRVIATKPGIGSQIIKMQITSDVDNQVHSHFETRFIYPPKS